MRQNEKKSALGRCRISVTVPRMAVLIFMALALAGCASAAKKAGKTVASSTVTSAKVTAKTTAKAAKAVGKGTAAAASGAVHMITGDGDDSDE